MNLPTSTHVGRLYVESRHLPSTQGGGGDIHDVMATPFGVRLLVGDVMGTGLPANRTGLSVLNAWRDLACTEPSLAGIAVRLHALIARSGHPERFVTALLMNFPVESADGSAPPAGSRAELVGTLIAATSCVTVRCRGWTPGRTCAGGRTGDGSAAGRQGAHADGRGGPWARRGPAGRTTGDRRRGRWWATASSGIVISGPGAATDAGMKRFRGERPWEAAARRGGDGRCQGHHCLSGSHGRRSSGTTTRSPGSTCASCSPGTRAGASG